mmetsp:Transcript_12145/g.16559  ORF Transcript_12145/g.16559 Transcript_12145/m.16559 type:complete len:142 (+) Transcript_12145:278-703(+)
MPATPVNVIINAPFRTTPQVTIPSFKEVSHPILPFEDLSIEEKVILESLTGPDSSVEELDGFRIQGLNGEWESMVAKYTSQGLSREQAAMGLTAHGDVEEKVKEFALAYSKMTELGFPRGKATGTLVINKNDISASIDSLM